MAMPLGGWMNEDFQHSSGNEVKVAIYRSGRAKAMVRCMDWAALLWVSSYPFFKWVICLY